MSKEKFLNPWKKLAKSWSLWTVGARPSPKNIADYQKFLKQATKNKKTPKVLLLGATPEIRDMLALNPRIEVTVLDANFEMILAMTDLIKRKSNHETWVIADWLTAPLQQNYYDAVLGDFIKGNIPYNKQFQLYKRINQLLKPTGYLIERVYARFSHSPVYNAREIIKRYSKISPNYQTANDLLGYLVFMCKDNKEMSSNKMFKILKNNIRRQNIKKFFQLISNLISSGKRWDYWRPWEESSKPILKYFKIVDKADDDTFYKKWSYLFKLKPKK